ncbi:MAG TPA: hypothetical protein HPP58_06185 [Deltaproteobacteria bacterium]|nr:hypothetical protein [Deltaproteobacteria bacterium]
MEPPQVHLSNWFEKGFQQYKENISILIPASFIALILTVASAGILAGPMLSGLLIITLGLQEGGEPKPKVSDLFRGFGFFLHSLLFVVVWGVAASAGALVLLFVPGVGQLAALFFVYAAQAFLMFGPFLIVDRNMDFRSASVASFQTVKSNFWPFLSVSAVASVIGSIGGILFGIGIIVTAPLQACILTVAYGAVFGPGKNAH